MGNSRIEQSPLTVSAPTAATCTTNGQDSLFSLAKEILGNGDRWPEIARQNHRLKHLLGQQIRDPQAPLPKGIKLNLPLVVAPRVTVDATQRWQPQLPQAGDAFGSVARAASDPRLTGIGAPPPAPLQNGPWTTVQTPFPMASTMVMMHDGSLLCQQEGLPNWWKLVPDATGSYQSGTWTQVAPMSTSRLYYASAALNDGRLVVMGGEYSKAGSDTNTGEIYDPVANQWTPISPPPGWNSVGDAACSVLPDGRILLASIMDGRTAIWDPKTMNDPVTHGWSDGGTKLARSSEESWVLQPDGSVLTVDCSPERQGRSELWTPNGSGGGQWVDAGPLPAGAPLVEAASQEIGPGILMQDGRTLFVGATGHTALYTPSQTPGQVGTWAQGPDLPPDAKGQAVAKDAPGALLPNGHVLVAASSLPQGGANDYGGPTSFYDFDPVAMSWTPVQTPPLLPGTLGGDSPFRGRMMILPTGEIAYTHGQNQISFFTPQGPPTGPQPVITNSALNAAPGTTIQLTGTGFTGDSQDAMYGDDVATSGNYPEARLTGPDGTVAYLNVHDCSTMGIATGNTPVTAQVDIPSSLANGSYQLQIVSNGVASAPVALQVGPASVNPLVDPNDVKQAYGSVNFEDGSLTPLDPSSDFAALSPGLQSALNGDLNNATFQGGSVYTVTVDGQPTYAVVSQPGSDTSDGSDDGLSLHVYDANGTNETTAHPSGQPGGFSWD